MLLTAFKEMKSTVRQTMETCRKGWWVKYYLCMVYIVSNLWWHTPYKKALAIMAYLKYRETYMFKERARLFGEDEALKMFTVNKGEFKLFYHNLTWKNHLKAVFIPFNYLEALQ